MATDLERFVGAEGRADLVKEVRRRIDAEGITYIYYQFPSVTGRIMGKGVPAQHWETIAREGLPARVRRDGEPLHRPPRQLHRLRTRGRRARRHPGAGDLPAAPVGPEGRARLVHLLPQPRGARGSRRVPHLRLPRQPQAPAGGVRGGDRPAPSRRHRAGDDVARAQRGRHARGHGQDEALLLPHRPVLRAPADHPQGRRVRPGDGARHDPGRPRGRARPDRAELRLRPRGEDGRQPLDLPADLQGRRPRARRLPVLHAEAVHGRLGERLPPQHLAVEGRRERVHAGDRRPAEAEPDRPLRDRRHPRAPRRAHRGHRLDGQLLSHGSGTPASGRPSSPTGATRTGRPRCASPRPVASSTARSTRR